MFNFQESIDRTSNEFGGGTFFKLKEGDTRLRVLASSLDPIATHFVGKSPVTCVGIDKGCSLHGEGAPIDPGTGKIKKPAIKYPTYCLVDKKIELLYMPYSIIKSLSALQNSSDWAFEDLPMPYDITIKYDSKAAPIEMYKVMPSPKREAIPAEIIIELKAKKSLDEIVTNSKARVQKSDQPELEDLDSINLD